MSFHSILYRTPSDEPGGRSSRRPPEHFVDLALDQVVASVTAAKQEYGLEPDFYAPLHDPDAVAYRHEVVRDLQREAVMSAVIDFARGMRSMRERLAEQAGAHYRHQKERWFLDAVEGYCASVRGLERALAQAEPASRGLSELVDYLDAYVGSAAFMQLEDWTGKLKRALDAVRYEVVIQGNTVKVRGYRDEADYSTRVLATFAKFQESSAKDYRAKLKADASMNHVEAQILDGVAGLQPELFADLDRYCKDNANYLDDHIAAFDREVQFYVAYLEQVRRLEHAGLHFSLPEIAPSWRGTHAVHMFDAALADKLRHEDRPVVTNDFHLDGDQRLVVVTGPNQGGKTTYARAFGQLHYLAALGLPVPATTARLHLGDALYTHFERQERVEDLRGKLHEELARMHRALERTGRDSVVIMNEAFSSTTASDALQLNREILVRLDERGALCLVVTVLDELASLNDRTVSMVSGVDPQDPTVRTFRLERRPADGRAYAIAIARKYGITREALKTRLPA
ncbi:MAG: hypothetical protein P8Z81_04875 [Deinococcales bacterium]